VKINHTVRAVLAMVALATLSGCPARFPTCSSNPVASPGGLCSAYYYKADYGAGGAVTQALVDCTIEGQRLGSNIVAFNRLDYGIGLRWLDARTLEVAVPASINMKDQRKTGFYSGHVLTYRYRTMRPDEPAFSGCRPIASRLSTW
jgi:hypothetical protein